MQAIQNMEALCCLGLAVSGWYQSPSAGLLSQTEKPCKKCTVSLGQDQIQKQKDLLLDTEARRMILQGVAGKASSSSACFS